MACSRTSSAGGPPTSQSQAAFPTEMLHPHQGLTAAAATAITNAGSTPDEYLPVATAVLVLTYDRVRRPPVAARYSVRVSVRREACLVPGQLPDVEDGELPERTIPRRCAGSQGHPREALQIANSVLEGPYRLKALVPHPKGARHGPGRRRQRSRPAARDPVAVPPRAGPAVRTCSPGRRRSGRRGPRRGRCRAPIRSPVSARSRPRSSARARRTRARHPHTSTFAD